MTPELLFWVIVSSLLVFGAAVRTIDVRKHRLHAAVAGAMTMLAALTVAFTVTLQGDCARNVKCQEPENFSLLAAGIVLAIIALIVAEHTRRKKATGTR